MLFDLMKEVGKFLVLRTFNIYSPETQLNMNTNEA